MVARCTGALLGMLCVVALASPQGEPHSYADYHQHLFSPEIARRSPSLQPIAAADLVPLLDAAGIERAAVLSLGYQFGNPNRPPVEDEYRARQGRERLDQPRSRSIPTAARWLLRRQSTPRLRP